MRSLRLALAAVIGACLAATPASGLSQPTTYLVKLRGEAWSDPGRVLLRYPIQRWSRLDVPGWVRVTVAEPGHGVSQSRLRSDASVLAVQEDGRVSAVLAPNDEYWTRQWGPAKVNAPAAWDVTTGNPGLVIAVVDTGTDTDHPDLMGQLWVNVGEIAGNGLDDDGNGKVDDIHGWRFYHDAAGNPIENNQVEDDHGHGTHVAGIIAAAGNNGQGIAGMAWSCRLMTLKVLDSSGDGQESDVGNALVYATNNGARIVNLSLGGTQDSPVMRDAVDYATARGVLVIAAAGNTDSAVLYPAAYENAVAVVASDPADQRVSYSCHGPAVDLTAPGSGIYSTCMNGQYCYKSGTSMATPHVAGLAALVWTVHPLCLAAQVRIILANSAQDIDSPGWDPYTGWGRIDAQRAISAQTTCSIYALYFPVFMQTAPLVQP